MTAVATRERTNNTKTVKLRTTSDYVTEDDDDYVIEDDLNAEEIAFLTKCAEEREKGLVKYIPLEDIDWGL